MQLRCNQKTTLKNGIAAVCLLYICTVLLFYYGIQKSRTANKVRSENKQKYALPLDHRDPERQIPISELPLYIRQRSRRFSPKWKAMKENYGSVDRVRRSRIKPAPEASCAGNYQGKEYEFVEVVLGKLFIFSAYFDGRENDFDNRQNSSYIRLISVMRGRAGPSHLVCIFLDDHGFEKRTKVAFYEMCENHGRRFGGFILSCPVPSGINKQPCSVTVSEDGPDAVPYSLKVLSIRPNRNRDRFRVCVPPLFGKVGATSIVEFVEVSRLLGAQRIVFYDYQITGDTAKVLDYYQNKGYVDVIPWLYPADLDQGSWYHGQLIAVQDCLYRNMPHTEYLLFNDLDEYLVPHEHDSWAQLVEAKFQADQCAFQFNSALYPDVDKNGTTVLTATRRTSHFSRMRTKCMVRPYLIFEKGIHHVSKPIWAWLAVRRMTEDVAFIHHYRPCTAGFDISCRDYIQDTIMLKYEKNITANIENTIRHLNAKSGIE